MIGHTATKYLDQKRKGQNEISSVFQIISLRLRVSYLVRGYSLYVLLRYLPPEKAEELSTLLLFLVFHRLFSSLQKSSVCLNIDLRELSTHFQFVCLFVV
jgi:hypothetical protein